MFGEDVGLRDRPLCERFRIGSSNVWKLITGDVGVRDAHGDYFSGVNRFEGAKAEDTVRQEFSYGVEIDHPFLVSADFPFICATPDFIVKYHRSPPLLVEVKSGTSRTQALANAKSKRSLTQVETALQVCDLKEAVIVPVIRAADDKSDNQMLEYISVHNDDVLFRHRKQVLDGYVRYLDEYFPHIYGIRLDAEMKRSIRQLLETRVPRRKRTKRCSTLAQVRKRVDAARSDKKHKCEKGQGQRAPHGLDGPMRLPRKKKSN